MLYLIEGFDNTDKNLMMVTYDNGQTWYPSLYDLDSTFGSWWDGTLNETYEILPDNSGSKLWTKMLDCFPNEIANRWFELRKDIFDKDEILEEFRNFINSIPNELYEKDAEKWGNIPGFGIDQIEEYLNFRLPYIDGIMCGKYTIEPEVTMAYSTTEKTNKDITINLEKNRNDIKILKDGQEIDENSYLVDKNGTYLFEVQDGIGNKIQTLSASIDWIDKEAPIISVKYEPESKTRGEVIVTINSNEELQELNGWELSQDKLSLKKSYSKNLTDSIEVKDLVGNIRN